MIILIFTGKRSNKEKLKKLSLAMLAEKWKDNTLGMRVQDAELSSLTSLTSSKFFNFQQQLK